MRAWCACVVCTCACAPLPPGPGPAAPSRHLRVLVCGISVFAKDPKLSVTGFQEYGSCGAENTWMLALLDLFCREIRVFPFDVVVVIFQQKPNVLPGASSLYLRAHRPGALGLQGRGCLEALGRGAPWPWSVCTPKGVVPCCPRDPEAETSAEPRPRGVHETGPRQEETGPAFEDTAGVFTPGHSEQLSWELRRRCRGPSRPDWTSRGVGWWQQGGAAVAQAVVA